jgi:hypothetical protein
MRCHPVPRIFPILTGIPASIDRSPRDARGRRSPRPARAHRGRARSSVAAGEAARAGGGVPPLPRHALHRLERYQATKWSGLQARQYAQAAASHAAANRSSTLAGQERLQDLLNFNRWLETSTSGDTTLADLYVRRFRPEFRPAFDAWLAQEPLHNTAATATPLLMPQYEVTDFEKADRLDSAGTAFFNSAKHDTEQVDAYVFGTLLFAGISMRFSWIPIRVSVMIGAGLGCEPPRATFIPFG